MTDGERFVTHQAIKATGTPGDRPPGFPCFHCGDQVRTERAVLVEWPDGTNTFEPCCDECPAKVLKALGDQP